MPSVSGNGAFKELSLLTHYLYIIIYSENNFMVVMSTSIAMKNEILFDQTNGVKSHKYWTRIFLSY